MKYCSNCGSEVNENAAVCVKCGFALKTNEVLSTSNAQQQSSNASMVLGILAVIFGAIAFILTIAVQSYLTTTYQKNRKSFT